MCNLRMQVGTTRSIKIGVVKTIVTRVWVLIALFGAAVYPAYAVHDPAPLPEQVVKKITSRYHGVIPPTPGQSLEKHLDDITRITKGMGKSVRGAKLSTQADATNRMVLTGKRAELQAVLGEVRTRFKKLKGQLAIARQGQQDALLQQIENRFNQLDSALADIVKAKTSGQRSGALQRLQNLTQTLNQGRRNNLPDFGDRTISTFSAHKAPPSKPIVPSTVTPAYLAQYETPDTENNWLQDLAFFIIAEAQAAAPVTPSEAASCSYTVADLADDTLDVKLTQEIQDLAASLNYSPARIFEYVSNTIHFEPYYGGLKGAVGTLYGKAGGATDQASLLIALLRASNVPARYVQGIVDINETSAMGANGRAARWVGAKNSSAASSVLSQGDNPTVITFTGDQGVRMAHVWVEACLPYVNYRGMAADNTGHRWLPLDPSFKDKTYQAGIATSVSFDFPGFLATRTNILPHEAFESQVDAAAKLINPNNTLNDVPYAGAINPVKFDVLPATLPYEVNTFTNWSNTGTPETSVLPDSHRYQFNISVNGADISSSLLYPDIIHDRITLSYKGATAGDQASLDAWIADGNPDSTIPCGINLIPSLKRESSEIAAGAAVVDICSINNTLDMSVTLPDGRSFPSPANSTSFTNIGAANYYALQGYAYQGSDRLFAERAARLVNSVNTISDPNTNLDETEGEFLHIVGLKYMRHITDANQRIGELNGESGESGHHLGVAASQTKVQYIFDLPFAVRRAGLLVDMPGVRSNSVDLATGNLVFDSFLLGGYSSSSFESFVWQENAKLDAVSTVRGIQFANENGIEVLVLTSANWLAESPKFTSNADPTKNYSAAQVSQIKTNYIDLGYTVTAPRSLIEYDTWLGTVFVAELNNLPTSASAGYIISGGYAGGFSVIDPPPGTDYDFQSYTQGNIDGVTPYITSSFDPVNMVNGNMYHTEVDINISGRGGLPLVFERYYNSGEDMDGPLGFGWTHSFNHFLRFNDDNFDLTAEAEDTDGITSSASWIDGTGAERIFAVTGDAGGVPVSSVFTNQPGVYVTVNRDVGGTYSLREKNGLTYTFENIAGTLGQIARLVSIQDRKGNTLALTYDATGLDLVTDDLGRSLDFTNTSSHITQIQDWTGRTWQYQYDVNNNLSVSLNPLAVAGTQPPVTYDYYLATDGVMLDHKMRSFNLPRSNSMTFEYYANGKVFRHFTTLGEAVTFNYNEFRRESTTVNQLGHTRQYFFDEYGNQTSVIEEAGARRSYIYDAVQVHNRLSQTDPMGLQTQYGYDAVGNVTTITTPSGSNAVFSDFTAFNQPGKVKDANGIYTINQYDPNGNLTNIIRLKSGIGAAIDPATYVPIPGDIVAWSIHIYDGFGNRVTTKQVRDFTTQEGPTVTFTYDTNNLYPTAVTRCGDKDGDGIIIDDPCDTETLIYDSLGRSERGIRADWEIVEYSYDDLGRITRGTDDAGQLRDFSYDENNNVVNVELTVNLGGTPTLMDQKSFTYDLSDRLASTMNAGGFVTRYDYDAAGNVIRLIDPDNYTLEFEYDENNRLRKAFDKEGHAVIRNLDDSGRLRKTIDPNGNATAMEYYGASRDGRLFRQVDSIIREVVFDYDANGNITILTDNLGRSTVTTYDELNRPVRIVRPDIDPGVGIMHPVTAYIYDNLGNMAEVNAGFNNTNPNDPGTDTLITQGTYTYDDFGRLLTEQDPNSNIRQYQYNVQSNVIRIDDPKGQVITRSYAYGGRLQTQTTEAFAGDPSPHVINYTRNSLGQLTQVVAPEVTYGYGYDAAHRLIQKSDNRGAKLLNYAYSPGGLLDQAIDSEGNQTDYLYDPVGRLTGIWAPNGDEVSFSYDAGGRLTEKWFPNGVNTQYVWNNDNSLAQVKNRVNYSDTNIITQHDYTYDGIGNRETYIENIGGATNQYRYLYDALNRLTEVQDNTTSSLIEGYGYDQLGNRTSITDGVNTSYYGYDAANQLETIRLNDPTTGTLTHGFVYDDNGNLTRKCEGGVVTRNATDCTGITTLDIGYDALDRLSQAVKTGIPTENYFYDGKGRRISKIVGAATTDYLYMGSDVFAEYTGGWTQASAITTHGPRVDDPIVRATPTTASYFHQDGLGSVVALSDDLGATVGTQRFDAWGNQQASTGSIPQYGYTGREPDATGLIYYRARYYDPGVGRFTQRDPLGFIDGVNRYAYAINNPVNYVDPQGLSAARPSGIQPYLGGPDPSYFTPPLPTRGLDGGFTNLDQICRGSCHGTLPNDATTTAADREFMQRLLWDSTVGATGIGGLATGVYDFGVDPSWVSFGMIAVEIIPGPNPARRVPGGGGTETVQRAMSRAELEAIQNSGTLSRGGRPGDYHVSDAVNSSANRAQQRLSLPQSPDVRVTIEVPQGVFSPPSTVNPDFGMPGGGLQRTAPGNLDIPATIIRVDEL